jgi:hypothetical protein
VRYDHNSIGDQTENESAHGTKVAIAAAGKLNGGDDSTNGIAEGAKLHLYDLRKGSGK